MLKKDIKTEELYKINKFLKLFMSEIKSSFTKINFSQLF